MADITYWLSDDGKFSVMGKPLKDARIKPYMREFKFSLGWGGRWVASKTTEEIDKFLEWVAERGWTAEPSTKPLRAKAVKAKTNKVTYYYGKSGGEEVAQLRGGGLQSVKPQLAGEGFKWVFSRGRRKVMAYEAFMSPHQLIEVLLMLKQHGLEISPSKSLAPKRWLYLDKPKVYETKAIKTGDEIPFETLAGWLDANGYERVAPVERPGDFAIMGDAFHVWTKDDDVLIRIVFDGETVESISRVDPESKNAAFAPDITINGLRELDAPAEIPTPPTVPVDPPQQARILAQPSPKPPRVAEPLKYHPTIVEQMNKKFVKLDESHPFFNMIKWE